MNDKEPSIWIGLEIHFNLKTENGKKIFNWIENYQNNLPPNQLISPWELGYLGTLPIINPDCLELALRLAVAFKMSPINEIIESSNPEESFEVVFDRKGYFYPDLPKWYQITQYYHPFAKGGFFPIIIKNDIKNIPIKTIHLEEDTAKSFYTDRGIELDFNRSGNPLIELTTDPIFNNAEEVNIFIKQLQNFCRYLDISEAKMEKGQLRVDLNFSLNLGKDYQTPRYEVKNLNSLSNITDVLKFEIAKHKKLFADNLPYPSSQTFGFDEKKKISITRREKINYFYLPEVNIPPIKIKKKHIQKAAEKIPILPWIKLKELANQGVKKINFIVENYLLLKIIIFLETKERLSPSQIDQWVGFFSNYLYFIENLDLFKKNWEDYWQIFKMLSNRELIPEEAKLIIRGLEMKEGNLAHLKKKYQKEKVFENQSIILILKDLWDEGTKLKYLLEPQKIQNYLLGQIRKRIPNLDVIKVRELIVKFIEDDLRKKA